jgi:peptidyl-prolyl cis-trans isomerase D
MLQAIREKVTGWIAYGIIFLISVPFALWGVNSYLGGGEVLPAATVNGEEVSLQELDRAYTNYRQRLAQLFGGSIPESFGSESMLRDQVLGELIEEYSLQQYTQKQGYRIADAELNRIIRGMNVFQRDGEFVAEIYQAQLRSQGYTPVGFEQQLRRNGSIEQFQNGIRATAFTVPAFEKQFASLSNQTRKIRSLTFKVEASSIVVDDEEVDQYYQLNADRFRTREKVKIDFIEVSLEAVKQGIQVSEDVVRARYEENKDAYSSAEIREASHILIKVSDDGDSDQALTRITEIREGIVNGESFADLAREFSEDPGSAQDGGNLGEIEPGIMVQTFEAALYSMQVDQLSEPVKTGFGWHLIKLHAIKGGETESFETVRTTLEDEIKTEMAEGQIYDLAENLANLTYEQSDSLLPAAEQLGLTVQTSDWFDRFSGEDVSAEQKVRQAAFSPEVLQQGLNSEAIELAGERVVFIRINQHQPAEGRPLEQVREQVVSEVTSRKARQKSLDAGKQALTELNSGKTFTGLAEEWSDSIKDYGFVKRDQADVDASILQHGFSMPKPDQGIVYDGLPMANGEYIVLELSAVISNDADVDQEAFDGLVQAQGATDYQSTLKLISSRADVVRTAPEDL